MRCIQGVYYCWAAVVVDWHGYRCFEVSNNAVWAEQVAWAAAEEFSRWSGFAAPVTISFFSSAVRTVGAQPYPFVDFPFMWSCNVLDGMLYCLAAAWALNFHCWQLPWLHATVHHFTGSFLLCSCTLLALLLYFVVVYKQQGVNSAHARLDLWPFNVAFCTVRNLMLVFLSVQGVR